MKLSCSIVLSVSALATLGGIASGHDGHHMTIDTAGGKAVIRVGFYATESDVTVDETGRVFDGEDFALARVIDRTGAFSSVSEWYAASEPWTLTSDFYFATGRLDGGDFNFEIVSVTAVQGTAGTLAYWAVANGTALNARAYSDGFTRDSRSFNVGAGGHEHGQVLAISNAGIYDITLVAWDTNGVFADSDPVTFRVVATCPTDFDGDGFVNGDDFDAFVAAFEAGDIEADFDEDGFVTGDDFDAFVAAFEGGC